MTNKRKIPMTTEKETGIDDVRSASSKTIQVFQVPMGHDEKLKEFDPYEMSVEKPTTYAETMVNFVKQNLGTGILALPNAIYHGGYLLGPICMIAVFVFSIYCKHMLLQTNYIVSKKRRVACMTYKDTITTSCEEGPPCFQKAGPYLRFLTDLNIVVGQIGTGVVYFTFIASNLKKVCDEYYEPVDQRVYSAAILVPLILMNYIQSYKYLAPVSLVTNAVTMASYGVILYYVFNDLRPLSERSAVGQWAHIPLFFGTVFFVYEPASMVIPMTREMKQPRQFASRFGVFHVGTAFVSVFYFIFGIFGYLAYGDKALGSVTLNLPLRELPANIARLSQCAVIFLSHAIQNYLVFEIMWSEWLAMKFKNPRWRILTEYCFRTAIISLECISSQFLIAPSKANYGPRWWSELVDHLFNRVLLAVVVSDLDLLISLTGALGTPFVGYIVPAAVYTACRWKTTWRKGVLAAQFAAVVVFATFAAAAGVVASVSSIARSSEPPCASPSSANFTSPLSAAASRTTRNFGF